MTLRSYALGAVHQALGMVWSEGIAVDEAGEPVDLTIRSFGILAARDMPEVTVRLHEEDGWPVNGSDAVFVATLAAAWIAEGLARPLAHAARRRACAVARRGTIGRSRGARMSPAVGPYSPVRRVGDWVITSGQVGLATDERGRGRAGRTAARWRSSARRCRTWPRCSPSRGRRCPTWSRRRCSSSTWREFAAVNEVWVEYFTENRPTRSAVAVAALPIGARVEVEAWAYAPVV